MARKKSGKKIASKAKTKRVGKTAGKRSPVVCEARGGRVEAELLKSSATKGQRRNMLSRIIKRIVDSCESLAEISHLDATVLPESEVVIQIVEVAREVFYPGYFGEKSYGSNNVAYHMGDRLHSLYRMLSEQVYRSVRHKCEQSGPECSHCRSLAEVNARQVLQRIPDIRKLLTLDVQAAIDGDPAAREFAEVILSYPGMLAISVYRLAHELWQLGVPLLPRMMTEYAHAVSGIDIHPGARIGKSFFIDHGTGVVIGETTIIGDRVKLYQGVTLGALSFPRDGCGDLIRGQKRHPTIEDDVTIYAQATILGGNTVVGKSSTIGGNVWLTDSVPPHTYVTLETPKLVVRTKRRRKKRKSK